MSIQNNYIPWAFGAGEALNDAKKGTGHIYKAVSQGQGKIANDGNTATGILQQVAPNSGHVTQGYMGIMKFTAGAAVNSADQELTVTTSGYMKLADDGDRVVGRTLASVGSGAVGYGVFDFSAPRLFDNNDEVFDLVGTTALVENYAVDFSTGAEADTSNVAGGIVVKAASSGDTGKVKVMGKMTFMAGAGVTADTSLKVTTNGYMLDAGSGYTIVGRAVAAVSSGQSGIGNFNFATPHFATNCLDVGI